MDDETSSRYIFLFMLLLIPFLAIGLSINAVHAGGGGGGGGNPPPKVFPP